MVRIGGQAELDDQIEAHVRLFERVFLPEEFAEWRRELERGRWMFVRLRPFADVADGDRVTRLYGELLETLQFDRDGGEDNLGHAREALPMALDTLVATLHAHGITATVESLGQLPISIEIDAALAAALV